MWAENITAADKEFSLDGEMEALVYEDGFQDSAVYDHYCAIVVDPRIPKEWRYDKLCFTGYGRPPIEVAKEMYEALGDPTNEFEQFTDPRSYHAKRGEIWDERGWVQGFGGVLAEAIKKHFAETGEILDPIVRKKIQEDNPPIPRVLKGKYTVEKIQEPISLVHPDVWDKLTKS